MGSFSFSMLCRLNLDLHMSVPGSELLCVPAPRTMKTEPVQAKPILVFYHVPGDGDEALSTFAKGQD